MYTKKRTIEYINFYIKNNQFSQAEYLLKEFLKVNKNDRDANEIIANLYCIQAKFQLAIPYLEALLSLKKGEFNTGYKLGSAYLNTGKAREAIKVLNNLIERFGKSFEVLHDLATSYACIGNFEKALNYYQECLELKPESFNLNYNIGRVYDEFKNYDAAIKFYDKSIEQNPSFDLAYVNKATDLAELRRFDESIRFFTKALELNPSIDWIFGDLINLYSKICDWDSISNLRKNLIQAIDLDRKVISPGIFLSLFDSIDHQYNVSKNYCYSKFPPKECLGDIRIEKGAKIKIGYFSADFHNHPTAYLMAQIFELHNKDKYEIFAFSFGPLTNDEMQLRLRQAFDHFYDVRNITDIEIAKLSRELKIDIAIDLKGYTQDARTGIFSYRAAPIQVNYLGYPGTMGSNYIDYIIADRNLIPEESKKYFTEKIVFLPNCYQPNDRKRAVINKIFSRKELGLPEDGFVYCCFNNNYKITSDAFSDWMKILKSVEGSVLWLFQDNQWAADNLKKEAINNGVNMDRIIFAERQAHADHLARYHAADLFLDTFPYGAHTTCSDALWVGLPVLTMMGDSFVSRVAASLLMTVELPDLVTRTRDDYIRIAIELGKSPDKVNSYKRRLNEKLLATPLFDSCLYTKNIEKAYSKIMEKYWSNSVIDHIYID